MQNGCWDSAKADCDRFIEVKKITAKRVNNFGTLKT